MRRLNLIQTSATQHVGLDWGWVRVVSMLSTRMCGWMDGWSGGWLRPSPAETALFLLGRLGFGWIMNTRHEHHVLCGCMGAFSLGGVW